MKTKPSNIQSKLQSKSPYEVAIKDQILTTWANSESQAISNAAYRYGLQERIDVKLILWKIKNSELECKAVKL